MELAPAKTRFGFLDGMRAFCACYVVLFHLVQNTNLKTSVALQGFLFGHYAVTVFIAISGFSLALSLFKAEEKKTDWAAYFKRRFLRIYPPYLLAYAISMALFVGFRVVRKQDFLMDVNGVGVNAIDPMKILMHLLLLHSLKLEWCLASPNGPLWSVSVEWIIYFLFPLILVPLFRRVHASLFLIIAWMLGSLVVVLNSQYALLSPWYVGVFSVGVLSAHYSRVRNSVLEKYATVGSIFALLAFVGMLIYFGSDITHGVVKSSLGLVIVSDFLLSLACLFVFYLGTSNAGSQAASVISQVFENKIAELVGKFSYSLYLVHFILLQIVFAKKREFDGLMGYLAAVVLFAAILGAAYLFYLVIERPSIRWMRSVGSKQQSSVLSGAR